MTYRRFASIYFAALLVAGIALVQPGCVKAPPNLTPAAQQAWTATQAINDLTALSQTAINLNAQTGALHLSIAITNDIRIATLVAGAGLQAWGSGQAALGVAKTTIAALPLPSDVLAAADAALAKAIQDHGAGASVLYLAVDVFVAANAKLQAGPTLPPALLAALNVVSNDIKLIPIPAPTGGL